MAPMVLVTNQVSGDISTGKLSSDDCVAREMKKTGEAEKVHIKRHLNLYQAAAFVAGTIVGSTIYIGPGDILRLSGSPGAALGVWVIAGFLSLLAALFYTEVALTYPSSGENFHYLDIMFGPLPAFCSTWSVVMVVRPGGAAIKLMIFSRYILALVFPSCEAPDTALMLISLLLLFLHASINIVNIEFANRAHSIVTGVSVAALISFSVVGVVQVASGNTGRWYEESMNSSPLNAGDFVFAIYISLFAYSGWGTLNFFVEEVKNPNKNIPLAVILSLLSVMILYILVNVAYIMALGPEGVITSPAVAMTFGQVAFPVVAWLVPIVVCSAQMSSISGGSRIASRAIFATARRGMLPECLSLITTWSYSPVSSIIFETLLTFVCLVLFDITSLITNVVYVQNVFMTLVNIGMLRRRISQPDLHRPFKMPLIIPAGFLLINVFLLAVPLVTKPLDAAIGIIFSLGTSIPLYLLFVTVRWRPVTLAKAMGHVTRLIQKLFLCMPQEKGVTW